MRSLRRVALDIGVGSLVILAIACGSPDAAETTPNSGFARATPVMPEATPTAEADVAIATAPVSTVAPIPIATATSRPVPPTAIQLPQPRRSPPT